MLVGSDRECASALLLGPSVAETLCETTSIPADCNLSPIFHLTDSLFYFVAGCNNTLNIYRGLTKINSTNKSTLFLLESEMIVAVNSTTMLKAQNVFQYETQLINNDTLMIVPDLSQFQLNRTELHIINFNRSLIWNEEDIDLGQRIQTKINKLKKRQRLMSVPEYSFFQSDSYLWNILKWCSIAILVVIIVILGIALIRVNRKVNALNALILVLALTSNQKTSSYEFCQDTSNTLSTAITIVDYCPMRFALTSFSLREVSPPKRGLKGLSKIHEDCASNPSDSQCSCFDRSVSRLKDYFYFSKEKILLPEEVTICSLNKRFVIPIPISIVQFSPLLCKVKSLPAQGFTLVDNGYTNCCLFRIVGSKYWWRTPGCSRDHLLSCITSSKNHVVARFDTPIACTANNIFIRLSLARRIASKGPTTTKALVPSTVPFLASAEIQWKPFLGFIPFSAMIIFLIIIYILCRFRYTFHLYDTSEPHKGCLMGSGKAIHLVDGRIRVVLHLPCACVAVPNSLCYRADGSFVTKALRLPHLEEIKLIYKMTTRLANRLKNGISSLRIVDNNGDDLHIQEESASPDIAGYQAVDTIYPLLVEEDADQDADTGTVLANSTV